MRRTGMKWSWVWGIALLLSLSAVAGCGSRSSSEGATSGGAAPVVPTMPPAKFTAVAQQAAAESSVLTQTTVLTQPVAAAGTDAQKLERGANIFVNRKCVECHGEQAEGVPDKGAPLAGTQLTYQEFDNILRTGRNGDLGPDHTYGPAAISPSGVDALHVWLQSLPAQ